MWTSGMDFVVVVFCETLLPCDSTKLFDAHGLELPKDVKKSIKQLNQKKDCENLFPEICFFYKKNTEKN